MPTPSLDGQDPRSIDRSGFESLKCLVRFLQPEGSGVGADGNFRRDSEQVQPVLPRIGRDALKRAFVKQIAVVHEWGNVRRINAGHGNGSTPFQGLQRMRHEVSNRGKHDRGMEFLGG